VTTRWTLHDPSLGETWALPNNPYEMTSPQPRREITSFGGVRDNLSQQRTFEAPMSRPVEWSFTGKIRGEDDYEAWHAWAARPGVVHITDHLGRTWKCMFRTFEAEEQPQSSRQTRRYIYNATVLNLGRTTP
jgi:hypothetical protein